MSRPPPPLTLRDAPWPDGEGPREKLQTRGAQTLSDAELIAVVLGSGSRGLPVLALSLQLLGEHVSLAGLACARHGALVQTPGIGDVAAARLLAAFELGRRSLHRLPQHPQALSSPGQAADFLCAQLGGYPHEVFACLFLDNKHRILAFEELFQGTIDGAAVYPREVVRRCLAHNAAAVILTHNHPSGVAEPSEADRAITRRLQDALGLIDVRVLDHLVVTCQGWVSLAERGWL